MLSVVPLLSPSKTTVRQFILTTFSVRRTQTILTTIFCVEDNDSSYHHCMCREHRQFSQPFSVWRTMTALTVIVCVQNTGKIIECVVCRTQHQHLIGENGPPLKMCAGFVWEHRILTLLSYASRTQVVNSDDHFVCVKNITIPIISCVKNIIVTIMFCVRKHKQFVTMSG